MAPGHSMANRGRQLRMTKQPFGKTAAGEAVELYTIANSNGVEVSIATYGGAIVSLKTPDRAGRIADVVLGLHTLDGYLKSPFYLDRKSTRLNSSHLGISYA